MRVSLEWVREYVDLPAEATARELAEELTLKTVEVEGWSTQGTDTVLEIDNKSLTNRPDLWGHHGIAREFAAIYGLPLEDPARGVRPARPVVVGGLIDDVDPGVCRRMSVIEFELPHELPQAPEWLADRIARVGGERSDILADLGTYVMYATGQPVDVVRDGRRCRIAVAALDPAVVRRNAQRSGLRTEATARHEKGIDTQRVDQAIDFCLVLLPELVPEVRILGMQDHDPDPTQRAEIELDLRFLDARIGTPIDPAEVRATLEALGFKVDLDGARLRVLAPTWRSTGDVSLPEDVLEEVARIHGYESVPVAPLVGTFTPLTPVDLHPLDRRVREQLAARAGMQEVVTYPWAADRMLEAAGHDPAHGVALADPPAPDRATLRPSLVPNLLEAVANTVATKLQHAASFSVYEVGAVYDGKRAQAWAGAFEPLPVQRKHAAAALVGEDGRALFLRAKGVVEMLARCCQIADLHLATEDTAATEAAGSATAVPRWADRHARLQLIAHGRRIGTLALVSARCRRLAGIEGIHVACFELDLDALTLNATRENSYRPIPEWPKGEFDLSVVVPEVTPWERLSASAESATMPPDVEIGRVAHVGQFRGGWVAAGHKSVTLQVSLRPRAGTLAGAQIAEARQEVIAALGRDLGARLREGLIMPTVAKSPE